MQSGVRVVTPPRSEPGRTQPPPLLCQHGHCIVKCHDTPAFIGHWAAQYNDANTWLHYYYPKCKPYISPNMQSFKDTPSWCDYRLSPDPSLQPNHLLFRSRHLDIWVTTAGARRDTRYKRFWLISSIGPDTKDDTLCRSHRLLTIASSSTHNALQITHDHNSSLN